MADNSSPSTPVLLESNADQPPRPFYLTQADDNNSTYINEYPSIEEFNNVVNDYLQNLSSKKRDKALVDTDRYNLILKVLKDPKNTTISTAQFRFWVKKMFRLSSTEYMDFVCHDGKPVATREDIYNILIIAHKEAHHGGRDKTSALVRKRHSWIPKELIARFVRHCPYCINRRNGNHVNLLPKMDEFDNLTSPSTTTLSSSALLRFLTSSPPPPSHLQTSGAPNSRKRKNNQQHHRSSTPTPPSHWYTSNISLVANVATSAAAAAVAAANAASSNNSSSSSPLSLDDIEFYYSQQSLESTNRQQPSPKSIDGGYNGARLPSYHYLLFNSPSSSIREDNNDPASAPSVAAAAVVAAAAMVANNNNNNKQQPPIVPLSPCNSASSTSSSPVNNEVVDDEDGDNEYMFDYGDDMKEEKDDGDKEEQEEINITTSISSNVSPRCSNSIYTSASAASTILSLLNHY